MEDYIDKLMDIAAKNNVIDKFTDILAKNYIFNRKDILTTNQRLLKQEVLEPDDKETAKTFNKVDDLRELPFKYIKSTKYGYQSLNNQDIKELKHNLQSLINTKQKQHQSHSTKYQISNHPVGDLEEMYQVHEQTLANLGEDQYEKALIKEEPDIINNFKDNLPF